MIALVFFSTVRFAHIITSSSYTQCMSNILMRFRFLMLQNESYFFCSTIHQKSNKKKQVNLLYDFIWQNAPDTFIRSVKLYWPDAIWWLANVNNIRRNNRIHKDPCKLEQAAIKQTNECWKSNLFIGERQAIIEFEDKANAPSGMYATHPVHKPITNTERKKARIIKI